MTIYTSLDTSKDKALFKNQRVRKQQPKPKKDQKRGPYSRRDAR